MVGAKLVLAVLVTSGGGVAVPKYTLYETAPVAAPQVKLAAGETPVAPWLGEKTVTSAGGWPALMVVASLALALAEPPPETVA